MTSRVAPAATFWPRATAIFSRRPETRAAMSMRVLSTSPCTSSGSERARYQIASPIMAKKMTPVMIARGLSCGLGRAVAAPDPIVARSRPDADAVDGEASVIVLNWL